MSAETLLLIAGVVLSLAFSLIPGLKGWYNKQESEIKQLIMLGLVVLSAATVFGLSCANVMADLWPAYAVDCSAGSLWLLVRYILFAVTGNVIAYRSTKYLLNGNDTEEKA